MKLVRFVLALIMTSAALSGCGGSGVEAGNPSGTITVTASGTGALVTVPASLFGGASDVNDSQVDIRLNDQNLALGLTASEFYDNTSGNVTFLVDSGAVSRSLAQGIIRSALADDDEIELILNKPNRSSSNYRALFNGNTPVNASLVGNATVNGASLIANAICDRIRACEPAATSAFCSLHMINEDSIGNVFLSTYGSLNSPSEESLSDVFDGIAVGDYEVEQGDLDICIAWIAARTCSGEETSVDNAFNPATPTDYTNVENMIADDGDCGRIITVLNP